MMASLLAAAGLFQFKAVILQPGKRHNGIYELNCKDNAWNQFFLDLGASRHLVVPDQVHENLTVVKIPENLTADVARSTMWEQYNKRCINCVRCNFVCPTCTCFTMQDL